MVFRNIYTLPNTFSMSTSRRKQNHPNKFGAKENSTVDNNRPPIENGKIETTEPPEDEETPTLCKQQQEASRNVVIRAGATFGPFPYLKDCSTDENLIMITDVSGKSRSYRMKESLAQQWLEQLTFSNALDECNSILHDNGNELKLTVSKDVSSVKDFAVVLETDSNLPNGHVESYCSDAVSPHSSENMPILAPEKQATVLTKNYACDSCGTRFSNPKTLEAHKTFYCGKTFNPSATENVSPKDLGLKRSSIGSTVENSTATATATISIDCNAGLDQPIKILPPLPSNNNTQHFINLSALSSSSPVVSGHHFLNANTPSTVILLPCAFTDNDVVQIVGYPQTVIPVAVSRNMQISGRHVVLEEALLNGVRFPADHVIVDRYASKSVNAASINNCRSPNSRTENLPFKLSLVVKTNSGALRSVTPPSSALGHSSPGTSGIRKRNTVDKSCSPCPAPPGVPPPSYHQQRRNTTVGHLTTTTTATPVKFPCPNCGVTFSSEKTLDGHLAFYCSANKNSSKIDAKMQRKIVENQRLCCHACDVTVGTTAELANHVRVAHGEDDDDDSSSPNHVTTHQSPPFTCALCEFKANSLRGVKTHAKFAHPDAELTVAAATCASADARSTATNKIRTCRSNAGTPNTSKSNGIISGQNRHRRCHDDDDGGEEPQQQPDWKRRRASYPLLSNGDDGGSTATADSSPKNDEVGRSTQIATKTTTPSPSVNGLNDLATKYKCEFCSYKSPYKGNVKRHSNLVHKNVDVSSNGAKEESE